MKYNVAVQEREYVWLLSLDGFRSQAEAERAIKWQREGDFHQIMYVVAPNFNAGKSKYKTGTNRYRIISSHGEINNYHPDWCGRKSVGTVVRPVRGSWTEIAWKTLIRAIWPPNNGTVLSGAPV